MTLTERVAEIRKTLVAAAGLLAQAISVGVLHGTALHYAQIIEAALTAVLVYQVPNGTADALDELGDPPLDEPAHAAEHAAPEGV
jgi:hypothetical protein